MSPKTNECHNRNEESATDEYEKRLELSSEDLQPKIEPLWAKLGGLQ